MNQSSRSGIFNAQRRRLLTVLVLALALAAAARAQTYQVIIYEPTAGFSDTEGAGTGGGQNVGSGRLAGSTSPGDTHAFLWTGASTAPVDLNPAGWTYSTGWGTDGTRQVGYVENRIVSLIDRRAALWNGSASDFVILSNRFSEAFAAAGDQQVGYVDDSFTCSECGTTIVEYAALWRGTSQSLVNLHPRLPGCALSRAADTDGAQQVGECLFQIPGQEGGTRAILWSGTAQSAVVLQPPNYVETTALGVKNGAQVGYGLTGNNSADPVALLWRGTPQSAVALGRGIARATTGTTHVGESFNNNHSNAFRWDGDAGAGLNLHALLPPGVYSDSIALDVDADGNIFGVAQRPDGRTRAVQWRVVNGPAPRRASFDFDGDGKSDVSVFRQGTWYLQQSNAGFAAINFGAGTDTLAPADYDGDGKTDVAVFRDGAWYLMRSQLGFASANFGLAGDVPQPGDYDNDGKADLAVFRPSNGTWYWQLSGGGTGRLLFGAAGDKPVAADYDGDGRADAAVYRGGAWYVLRSRDGFTAAQFGIATDAPVAADYDGDGKVDYAVYRQGTWYALGSRDGFFAAQFGAGGDIPVADDYDGDGRADVAVFRGGTWYLRRSRDGFAAVQFGQANDRPIPAAFVP